MDSFSEASIKNIEFLKKSYDNGNLVHAYLFFGGDDFEKFNVAKEFAKLLLTPSKIVRRLIDEENHPNVLIVKPDGKNIKKEQIAFLKSEIAKKSIENQAQIYIIEDAQKMSTSAVNSLLKFLEEPAEDVYLILIAPSKELLLPTVISRCATLNFGITLTNKDIDPQYLSVINELEKKAPQLVVAQNQEIFKQEIHLFLSALGIYEKNKLNEALAPTDVALMKKIIKKIRAIETAKRSLTYNMNTSLCLDKLWIDGDY